MHPEREGGASLEVTFPDGLHRSIPVAESPFFIGSEQTNHFSIPGSRAVIVSEAGSYYLEDLGSRAGTFVNREKVSKHVLQDGDLLSFGPDETYRVIFRSAAAGETIDDLLTRMDSVSTAETSAAGLGKLNLLLEATMLLHSHLPLDAILDSMLDRAIDLTKADRGLLLEAAEDGTLRHRLARAAGAVSVPAAEIAPSKTALQLATEYRKGIVTADLEQGDNALAGARSIIAQRLRAVVAIPLYGTSRSQSSDSGQATTRSDLLAILYMDSRRPAAFSTLDRQILDALAVEAASILDNARLVERERQRERLEQELDIARNIQQALLPRGFRDFPELAVSGVNYPCHAVGGDYFDVFPMGDGRTGFVVADVAGKGLGAALVTTMLQGALTGMTLGADPSQVFRHINAFLCGHSEIGRYATMFFGMLGSNGVLEFLNAGHPSPLVLCRGEVRPLFTEGSLPIGLIPEATYSSERAILAPGETLVLFSDGVTEAADIGGELFGVPRLSEVLAGQHDASVEELQSKIVESVQRFASGADQADDITLLLVRPRISPQLPR